MTKSKSQPARAPVPGLRSGMAAVTRRALHLTGRPLSLDEQRGLFADVALRTEYRRILHAGSPRSGSVRAREAALAIHLDAVYPHSLPEKGMSRMDRADRNDDVALIEAMLAGDQAAQAAFKARHEKLFLQLCRTVTSRDATAKQALRGLLESPAFPALFAGFKGGSSFATYAAKVVVDTYVFAWLLGLMREDPAASFPEFEAYFHRRIRRIINDRVGAPDIRPDASQWVMEQIVRNDFEQIRLWAAQAKTPGFIVKILKNRVTDFQNSKDAPAGGRKRTIPEPIERLSAFDQAVFKQIYWSPGNSFGGTLVEIRNAYPSATDDMVAGARVRIYAALASDTYWRGYSGAWSTVPIDDKLVGPSDSLPRHEDPEARIKADELNEEAKAFRAVVFAAARGLSKPERQCLLKVCRMKTAGTIAREMNLSADEVYKLIQGVKNFLRKHLSSDATAISFFTTVHGREPSQKSGSKPKSLQAQKGVGS